MTSGMTKSAVVAAAVALVTGSAGDSMCVDPVSPDYVMRLEAANYDHSEGKWTDSSGRGNHAYATGVDLDTSYTDIAWRCCEFGGMEAVYVDQEGEEVSGEEEVIAHREC